MRTEQRCGARNKVIVCGLLEQRKGNYVKIAPDVSKRMLKSIIRDSTGPVSIICINGGRGNNGLAN
jgi:hypothetical protein